LTTLAGSGPGGIILRRDVEAASAAAATAHQPAPLTALTAAGAASVVRPAAPVGLPAEAERVPIRGVLRAMADKLSRSRREIADALVRLTAAARDGKLTPADLTGGTFTLNNYGVYGVDGSTPIINHPEAAMLGVGRIVDKPWVVDGQLAVRKVTQLSFTFDHR